ncbi:MAG: hypothetical protein IJ300_04700, partial [Clostridia bacterium]|nr:hypothetical protein [Clostridia bacterium]
ALNNKIINGTFENGMPSGWTLSGLTMTAETVNVAENSFTAAKLAGSGTIEVNPTIYGNELYDASISVKPVSGNVNVSLVADFGNGLEYTVFNGAATSGSWTKLSGNLLRFIGTAYKNSAAVTASHKLILNVDGSCYIDEFTLTPAKNLLLSTDGIRVMSSNDGTEVGGWYNRGNVAAEKTSDGVKITATDGINNCIAQYVVLEKNSTYTLKANLKAVDAAADGECTVYGAYSGAKFANVAITDDGVLFEKTIDLSSKDVADIVASCVAFTDADMYVSNASLVKDVKFAAPSATVVLDATAIQGDSVSAVAVPSFIEGDAVGYKYSYKLDNVTVKAGYATGDTIPAVTVPQPEGNTGSLTLTLIPVNTEGSYGAAYTSAPCTVSRHFVVNADSVPASSITAGGTVSLNVNVENNSDGNQTIAVIAAYYENNAMINCDILQQEITAGNDKDYSLSVALPGTITGNGNFSVFVWKGYDGNVFSMEPVSPVINPIN